MTSHVEIEVEEDGVVQPEGELDLDHIAQQVQTLFESKISTVRWASAPINAWQSPKPPSS